ncbi:MAG TPA: hypothetical protein VMZ90_15020 [Vicinamibacterales bacterium]|nr:hypothetical protein [Vicinamibacterales bacterium]
MAHKGIVIVLGMIVATSPTAAAQAQDAAMAPAAGPGSRYCMHIESPTGSRAERLECWTREEWAEQGVDVDRDWAKEGVTVQG